MLATASCLLGRILFLFVAHTSWVQHEGNLLQHTLQYLQTKENRELAKVVTFLSDAHLLLNIPSNQNFFLSMKVSFTN